MGQMQQNTFVIIIVIMNMFELLFLGCHHGIYKLKFGTSFNTKQTS